MAVDKSEFVSVKVKTNDRMTREWVVFCWSLALKYFFHYIHFCANIEKLFFLFRKAGGRRRIYDSEIFFNFFVSSLFCKELLTIWLFRQGGSARRRTRSKQIVIFLVCIQFVISLKEALQLSNYDLENCYYLSSTSC